MGQRQTPDGADLNRDYLHQLTEEVRTQLASIDSMHPFDLALFLHEDWEANGFYLYELLDKESQSSIGDGILNEVARHAPLEMATVIDGREASNGLIQAPFNPCSRHDWPEAFYFMNRGTPHCLTLEAPSDFELKHRVHWLQVGVRAALEQLHTRALLGPYTPPNPPSFTLLTIHPDSHRTVINQCHLHVCAEYTGHHRTADCRF